MQYMGSKNRYAKEVVPIIQKYIDDNNIEQYLEPFVGGANVIDKIKCDKRVGCDLNEYLIALLQKVQKDVSEVPNFILYNEYKEVKSNKGEYEKWYQGLIGFCSFGSKFWGGYARNSKDDITGERTKSYFKSIKKQSQNIKDVTFCNMSFQDIPKEKIKGCVIYCDPPYRGATKYKTDTFPYEEYYDWCREMSKDNIILCSEYNMPDDFECIWSKETTTQINSNKNANDDKNIRTEKLFICKML